MTREDAERLAVAAALNAGQRQPYPAYLPRTVEQALTFKPHPWVVDAILAGAEETRVELAAKRGIH